VIASDGSLGGFSAPGGIKLKQKILDWEKATVQSGKAKILSL